MGKYPIEWLQRCFLSSMIDILCIFALGKIPSFNYSIQNDAKIQGLMLAQ